MEYGCECMSVDMVYRYVSYTVYRKCIACLVVLIPILHVTASGYGETESLSVQTVSSVSGKCGHRDWHNLKSLIASQHMHYRSFLYDDFL